MPRSESTVSRGPVAGTAIAGVALLSVRFIQGWIYWGGGSRRFIYGPQKLNPHAHWMAYKFQTAMPGAILGTGHVVAFLLHHFTLLYISVIAFSAVELIAGLMLIVGLFTRLAALATICVSFVLMLLFGWQGATCIDEWTMAASNFGMGITLLLAGAGAYSIDGLLLSRNSALENRAWFRWAAGALPLPLTGKAFNRLALILFWIGVAFAVCTYSYYRGSVVTAFHGGPVSPKKHHWKLTDATIAPDGTVTFHANVNAGTAAEASNVVRATVTSATGHILEAWKGSALAHLKPSDFRNEFDYQKIHAGPFGLSGPVGAVAIVSLPSVGKPSPIHGGSKLTLVSVNDHRWSIELDPSN